MSIAIAMRTYNMAKFRLYVKCSETRAFDIEAETANEAEHLFWDKDYTALDGEEVVDSEEFEVEQVNIGNLLVTDYDKKY